MSCDDPSRGRVGGADTFYATGEHAVSGQGGGCARWRASCSNERMIFYQHHQSLIVDSNAITSVHPYTVVEQFPRRVHADLVDPNRDPASLVLRGIS